MRILLKLIHLVQLKLYLFDPFEFLAFFSIINISLLNSLIILHNSTKAILTINYFNLKGICNLFLFFYSKLDHLTLFYF